MTSVKAPAFGITGWKNSGKTTLTTRLIGEFVRRGYQVATVKHAHHAFDVDVPGTDSFRHREAGASQVAVVSGARVALMQELRGSEEPALAEILDRLAPADLVLIEGYKREGHAKIECRRADGAPGKALAPADPTILAIASDMSTDTRPLPRFDLDDIAAIADFIADTLGLPAKDANAEAD